MTGATTWVMIGFAGQGLFTARFLVQWLASEKRRDSVVPEAFWWLSLAGGLTLLSYAIHRRDPVIISGQALGLFVYARNIMLIEKARLKAERRRLRELEGGEGPRPLGRHAKEAGRMVGNERSEI